MSYQRSSSLRAHALAVCLFSLAGCAAGSARPSSMSLSAVETERTATHSPWTSITPADLQSVSAVSTLDAVRQLRPDFLRASARRSNRDATGPALYVNRTYIGDIAWLALIPMSEVRDIAFLHPTEAWFRFGTTCQCGGGVLSVQTDPVRAP